MSARSWFPTEASVLIAPIAVATLLLAGCGNSGKTAARSTAVAPTATMIGSGRQPVAGSSGTPPGKRASTMATGKHDHAGEFCSGRDQARYAGEGLNCVTGRLRPTK
jgi:hypothetical protein